jgi:hypothetical protein
MARYLIYLRPDAYENTTSEILSKTAGISRADANRVIRSQVPKSIAVCESPAEVKKRIEELRRKGLDGIAITREAMHAFEPIEVSSATKGDGGMFWNTGDEPIWLGTDDVKMILIGKIQKRSETEEVSRYKGPYDMLVNDFASSSENRPTSNIRLTRKSSTRFLLLFCGLDEGYILRGDSFDFHTSLGYRAPTRKRSFDALIEILRETHPNALFDDALYNRPQVVQTFEKMYKRDDLALVAHGASRIKEGSTDGQMMRLAYLKYATALAGKD